MTDVSSPVILSIFIPTYNRARYLEALLEDLTQHIHEMKHAYEIIIGDNASTDDTEAVVSRFLDKLNIRYVRHERNLGGPANTSVIRRLAAGAFHAYLADDDLLVLPALNKAIDKMLANPSIGLLFTPWELFDRVNRKSAGFFYRLERDVLIKRGNHAGFLELVLTHHIFPEIYISRREITFGASSQQPTLSFFAFTDAAEYLQTHDILFINSADNYYKSVTAYFEGESPRSQAGTTEVQDHWDRYRGGLEYVMSKLAPGAIPPDKALWFVLRIQQFVAMRMSVALRLRLHARRNPMESYYLACRLKGLGFENLLPAPFQHMCINAIAYYVARGQFETETIEKIICVGNIPDVLKQAIAVWAKPMEVQMLETFDPEQHKHATVLVPGRAVDLPADPIIYYKRGLRVLGLEALVRRYS